MKQRDYLPTDHSPVKVIDAHSEAEAMAHFDGSVRAVADRHHGTNARTGRACYLYSVEMWDGALAGAPCPCGCGEALDAEEIR